VTLGQILALRPPESSTSATVIAAIHHAETRRAELLAAAVAADRVQADGLLSADDRALARAEQDATLSRRAVERIDALLPRLRLDLEEAVAREKMAALHGAAADLTATMAGMVEWQANKLPGIVAALREGFRLHDTLQAQHAGLTASVQDAYRDPFVRELGQFMPDLTAKGIPDFSKLPRSLFPLTCAG